MSKRQKLFPVPPKRREKKVPNMKAKDGFDKGGGNECRITWKWKALRIGKRSQKEAGNSDSGGSEAGIYMLAAAASSF